MITIQFNESICSRIALYAARHGIGWAEAIEDMLAKCEDNPNPASVATPPESAIAQSHLRSPKIICYLANGKLVSERECQQALLAAKKGTVRIHYTNGGVVDNPWRITKLQQGSYLRGNLQSGRLRGWRAKGIVKAEIFAGEVE